MDRGPGRVAAARARAASSRSRPSGAKRERCSRRASRAVSATAGPGARGRGGRGGRGRRTVARSGRGPPGGARRGDAASGRTTRCRRRGTAPECRRRSRCRIRRSRSAISVRARPEPRSPCIPTTGRAPVTQTVTVPRASVRKLRARDIAERTARHRAVLARRRRLGRARERRSALHGAVRDHRGHRLVLRGRHHRARGCPMARARRSVRRRRPRRRRPAYRRRDSRSCRRCRDSTFPADPASSSRSTTRRYDATVSRSRCTPPSVESSPRRPFSYGSTYRNAGCGDVDRRGEARELVVVHRRRHAHGRVGGGRDRQRRSARRCRSTCRRKRRPRRSCIRCS